MTNGLDALPERVDRLEQKVDVLDRKVDALSASVDQRFDSVERQFDQVSEAIAEQREYTRFAFERLDGSMREQFAQFRVAVADQIAQVRGEMAQRFGLVDEALRVMSAKLDRPGPSRRRKR